MTGGAPTRPDHARPGTGDDRVQVWEEKWSNPAFAPAWIATELPVEVEDSLADGWIDPESRVLDVGCGNGAIAARVAERVREVVAVDLSRAAIARARAAHGGAPRLTFAVDDFCEERGDRGTYDVVIDRGCLHGIPVESKPAFIRSIAAVTRPGGRFLLLHRIHPGSSEDDTVRSIGELCESDFTIARVAPTVMARDPRTGEMRPGVALWMTRR